MSMFFITQDRPGGDDGHGDDGASKRWSRPTALIVGAAVLITFMLTLAAIFSTSADRKTLDRIDQLMAAREWQRAETLCRKGLAERAAQQQAGDAKGSPWVNDLNMGADLRLRLGICLSMMERYDRARAVLDEAMELYPDDARIAINRALLEYRVENYEEALVRLQAVAAKATYAPHVNYHIGRIYEKWGRYDDALRAYRDELNISSSAGAWERYLILKRIRGATTTRPAETE